MLIKYLGCAGAALVVALALGLGSAESSAVGLGLAAGLFALNALPEPLEIDYFPHIRIPVRRKIGERRQSREGASCWQGQYPNGGTGDGQLVHFLNRPRKSLPSTNKKIRSALQTVSRLPARLNQKRTPLEVRRQLLWSIIISPTGKSKRSP